MYCPKCGFICKTFDDNGIQREHCSNCDYINYKNPYPCVSILIYDKDDENKILLGKRCKNSISPEKWCMPCGYIEYEETYKEAAIREVKEEVGISIVPDGIINVVSNKFSNGINSLVVVLIAKSSQKNSIVPGDDITECCWFNVNNLPELAFDADRFVINKYTTEKNAPVQFIPIAEP
jgi:NADH pyrophosphatase NudC (nudix superfamily)